VRREFVAQVAGCIQPLPSGLLAQVLDLADQHVDVLLLADNDLVQLVQQIFREAGLDFQVREALVCGV